MDATLHRLDLWLSHHRAQLRASLRPGATEEALDRCLGDPVHAQLRALYRWHDGQATSFLEGLDRFGMFLPLDQALRTMRELDELAAAGDFPCDAWWNRAWFPFLWSGGGSYLCVDFDGCFGGHPGQIVELIGDELERVIWFPDVRAWLDTLVDGLECGLLIARNGDVELSDPDRYEAFISQRYPGYPRVVPLEVPEMEGP